MPHRRAEWPYPTFADEQWLVTGEPDAALRAVTAAIRDTAGGHEPPLAAAAAIRERADWAILALVGEAHCAGRSWTEIGAELGISRQATHKRFAPYVEAALATAEDARTKSKSTGAVPRR